MSELTPMAAAQRLYVAHVVHYPIEGWRQAFEYAEENCSSPALSGKPVDHDEFAAWVTSDAPLARVARRCLESEATRRVCLGFYGWRDAYIDGRKRRARSFVDIDAMVAAAEAV